MSESSSEPAVLDIISGLGNVTRALIIRSLSGMATPRSADEIAETLNVSRDNAQEHIAVLAKLGVLTLTPAAGPTARPRYLVDTETLSRRLEQTRTYLLNQ
ncbi:ArsR/SmtB family transcription factor [Curtobacterium sp. SL109]|uniref:ArsR/SmtB family transcription factor n=1 Tax=Curtobacterium sp. SL109 TaxID=2994662 RepID=UPI00227446EB|nr:winged helix-turn-helix domain-containing protein [Curtobacterium sp. SL109]MCY1692885.1 winged helix-turn-helix domain-containing protein [Curtobacterium sp. SL109]